MAGPIVTQVGFSTASGTLAEIVDEDAGTGWAPVPDRFISYTAPFLSGGADPVLVGAVSGFAGVASGDPNVGASFPFLQFDYSVAVRLAAFLFQVESDLTLGPGCLIGSDFDATIPSQAVQAGDVVMGIYSGAELCGGQVLLTIAAQDQSVQKRYYRLLQRTSE